MSRKHFKRGKGNWWKRTYIRDTISMAQVYDVRVYAVHRWLPEQKKNWKREFYFIQPDDSKSLLCYYEIMPVTWFLFRYSFYCTAADTNLANKFSHRFELNPKISNFLVSPNAAISLVIRTISYSKRLFPFHKTHLRQRQKVAHFE